MNCTDRDQDLLLLAHGELSPLRRLRLLAHLRRCPRCRARQASLAGVSAALAGAIRPPGKGPWSPPSMAVPSGGLSVLGLWLLVLMVVGVLGVLSVEVWHSAHLREARSSSADVGCAPNLPNDRCR
ncbi:MAG TPA: zf-HC2 domain-containing protein [Chthonomonadaceae bacterium]|nr:zf-HC2 domain-containing protein [Chthonomonadaceae bacterium]